VKAVVSKTGSVERLESEPLILDGESEEAGFLEDSRKRGGVMAVLRYTSDQPLQWYGGRANQYGMSVIGKVAFTSGVEGEFLLPYSPLWPDVTLEVKDFDTGETLHSDSGFMNFGGGGGGNLGDISRDKRRPQLTGAGGLDMFSFEMGTQPQESKKIKFGPKKDDSTGMVDSFDLSGYCSIAVGELEEEEPPRIHVRVTGKKGDDGFDEKIDAVFNEQKGQYTFTANIPAELGDKIAIFPETWDVPTDHVFRFEFNK
ncbi:MAG: hypothetical protein GY849_09725, partial [Deltaproteobacteria bacterium]|nr:hypothetical protein [Deltaproteobacteria bacterium]